MARYGRQGVARHGSARQGKKTKEHNGFFSRPEMGGFFICKTLERRMVFGYIEGMGRRRADRKTLDA